MKDFLTKLFPQIVWFLGFKVLTLPPDTRNGKKRQKRAPQTVFARNETTETKLRAVLAL